MRRPWRGRRWRWVGGWRGRQSERERFNLRNCQEAIVAGQPECDVVAAHAVAVDCIWARERVHGWRVTAEEGRGGHHVRCRRVCEGTMSKGGVQAPKTIREGSTGLRGMNKGGGLACGTLVTCAVVRRRAGGTQAHPTRAQGIRSFAGDSSSDHTHVARRPTPRTAPAKSGRQDRRADCGRRRTRSVSLKAGARSAKGKSCGR